MKIHLYLGRYSFLFKLRDKIKEIIHMDFFLIVFKNNLIIKIPFIILLFQKELIDY